MLAVAHKCPQSAALAVIVDVMTKAKSYFCTKLQNSVAVLFILGVVAMPASAQIEVAPHVDQAIAFVKLGYGDLFDMSFRSLNFTTEELDTESTQSVVSLVKSYNSFDGNKIAQALSQFKGRISSYQFGREGSPVLYINLPYWTHQREGDNSNTRGTKIEDSEFRKLLGELRQVFVNDLYCDEFDVDSIRKRTVRVWWD